MDALERHLIAFLADAAAGDLASGHTELAVARLQAALEYNCFAPPIFGAACCWETFSPEALGSVVMTWCQ